MTARVIQGYFAAGQPRAVMAPVQPNAAASPRVGPPAPAFAPLAPVAQRHGGASVQSTVSRAAVAQRRAGDDSFQVDPARLGLVSGGGRPLPEAVRGKMEAALGADFSAVRVHVGPQAERIGALAFTTGTDIYFAPGRYQPDTAQGQQLLGHELAHVVQQRQGRVRTRGVGGVAVVQDRSLEAEAERLGQRAVAHRSPTQAKMIPTGAQISSPARVSRAVGASPHSAAGREIYRSEASKAAAVIGPGYRETTQCSTSRLRGPFHTSHATQLAAAIIRTPAVQRMISLAAHRNTALAAYASLCRGSGPTAVFGKSPLIQPFQGPIPKEGLKKNDVNALVKEAETTLYDMRGHAETRHGGGVEDEILYFRRRIDFDSAFDSSELLRITIEKVINDSRKTINSWLESRTSENLVIEVDMTDKLRPGQQLGQGYAGRTPPKQLITGLTSAEVIFRKTAVPDAKKPDQRARDTEWHLLTAYPVQ